MSSRPEIKNSFKLLLISSAVTVAVWLIPYAEVLVLPFKLFVTIIHEAAHAIAALTTLGDVNRISIDWAGNGLTETRGGVRFIVSSAGYVGTTIYGSALLLLLRSANYARAAAMATATLLLVITAFFAGNFVMWVVGLFFALGLLFLGIKCSVGAAHFFMSFLAVQALLNALQDLRVLLYLSVFEPSTRTDAQNMAIATDGFLPAIIWAALWATIALAILGFTLFQYYRSLRATRVTGVSSVIGG